MKDEDLIKDDYRDKDIRSFFTTKDKSDLKEGNLNRKFLKYEEGEIKHIRERDLGFREIIMETEREVKKTVKKSGKKDIISFIMIIFFVVSPIFLFSYYFTGDKEPIDTGVGTTVVEQLDDVNKLDKSNSKDIIIKSEAEDQKLTGIDKEYEDKTDKVSDSPKEELYDKSVDEIITFNEFVLAIEDKSDLYHNQIIQRISSYFDNKTSRAGLISFLERTLSKQKDLYVEMEVNEESYAGNEVKLAKLKDVVFNDISRTTELLDMTNSTISRDSVSSIYNKYGY